MNELPAVLKYYVPVFRLRVSSDFRQTFLNFLKHSSNFIHYQL
jgi:hypothetical protein